MQTALSAKTSTNTTINTLSYIDSLVTDASNKGLYSITVDGGRMNESMVNDLIDNYGYDVDVKYYNMGTYPSYVIRWDSQDIEDYFPNYILLWDFADVDSFNGDTNVYDISGNGDNGTIHNSPVAENGYIKLVGSSSQYVINNNDLTGYFAGSWPNRSTKISFVLSIYPTGNGMVLNESSLDGWHNSIIEIVGGQFRFGFWKTAGSLDYMNSNISTPLNNWYHVVMTYDGTTMKGYINGQLACSKTISRQEPYNLNPAKAIYYAFGAADSTNFGDGSYGDYYLQRAEILDGALSYNEILNKYQFHVDRFGA